MSNCRKLAPERGSAKSSGCVRMRWSCKLNWTNIRGRWGLGNGMSQRKYEIYFSIGTFCGWRLTRPWRKTRKRSKVSKNGQWERMHMDLLIFRDCMDGSVYWSFSSWDWFSFLRMPNFLKDFFRCGLEVFVSDGSVVFSINDKMY